MTTSTATSALSKLEALEAAAFAGENVTPKQLTDARAAVDLEAMIAAGAQHRAEQAAAAEREARRTAAKTDAATRVATVGTEAITAKFVAAITALDALVAAIVEHNATVVDVGRSLSAAGLPTDIGIDLPHFDADNHALTEHHQVVGATVAGVTYLSENAAKWVAPAVHDVALRNGKLVLPYGRSLAKILEAGVSPGDRPTAVTAALIERQAATTA